MRWAALAAAAGSIAVVAAALALAGGGEPTDPDPEPAPAADVVMPTKSSRPGCELDSMCYVPESIRVEAGRQVTWVNDDAAFHSVTSGPYGAPSGLFDSGYMDPGQPFSYTFGAPGKYEYHCTLHEWMRGIVIVV